jgi:hypothetical protein
MKKQRFIFLIIFLLGCLMSCNNNDLVGFSKVKTEKNTSAVESTKFADTKQQKLSSILYELATSPGPEQFAKKHHIFLDMDRVRVFILFDPSTSDPDRKKILYKHNITVEKSAARMIRGLVTVGQLIPLSGEPGIRFIKLPDKLIKAKEINP